MWLYVLHLAPWVARFRFETCGTRSAKAAEGLPPTPGRSASLASEDTDSQLGGASPPNSVFGHANHLTRGVDLIRWPQRTRCREGEPSYVVTVVSGRRDLEFQPAEPWDPFRVEARMRWTSASDAGTVRRRRNGAISATGDARSTVTGQPFTSLHPVGSTSLTVFRRSGTEIELPTGPSVAHIATCATGGGADRRNGLPRRSLWAWS